MTLKIGRREFLKTSALLGGATLLAAEAPSMASQKGSAAAGPKGTRDSQYDLAQAENMVYGVCLQCNTQCTLKGKLSNGVLVKLDGNPYSPVNYYPQIPYNTSPDVAAKIDGRLCPKGQAGVQTLYDPYRLVKVLKRNGPRGSNKWKTISFEQAIKEIVNGGKLFADIGEERVVPGFKDVFVAKDAAVFKTLAEDAAKVAGKEMSLADFKTKHAANLDLLLDPNHPDLGPKNNQFVFMAGRIEPGRSDWTKRFVLNSFGSVNWFEHTTICEQSHHVAYKWATAQYSDGKWSPGPNHMKPDFRWSRFVIFWGTGAFEANFGPTPMAEQITRALAEKGLKIAVVDPRFSKTAAHANWWIPVKPGGDLALALGMIQWILANERYDGKALANANRAAAEQDGEKSWTNATWLVKIDQDGQPGAFLRANEAGLVDGDKGKNLFVVSRNGQLVAVDPEDKDNPVEGDLFVTAEVNGMKVKSALTILKEQAASKSLEELASEAGVPVQAIIDLAREFTSYGKQAAIDFYRGAVQHTNGYYTAQAIIILNLLIGNVDWRGGLTTGGGSWAAGGGKPGQPFDLSKMHTGKITPWGVKLTREGAYYDRSTLFNGFPAERPWYPLTSDVYQEIIPAAGAGYPYPIKILWLHMGTPVLAAPAGAEQIKILCDTERIPLFIADDIVIGETSMYADYIFPDITYLERWAFLGAPPSTNTKTTKLRQPIAAPIPETVKVFGEEMPISVEAVMLAIAEALGLPGYGKDGFAPGWDFKRPEDYYLKAAANVAYGDKPGDEVPDADDRELAVFKAARRHLPPAVFNEAAWRRAVGEDRWRKTVYVLNRGGRFEESTGSAGKYVEHPFGKLINLYVEPVATTRDSITGRLFGGVPRLEPVSNSDGTPVKDADYPLQLITFKEIFGGQSRTIGNYWGQVALLPENFILMHRSDGARLGLRDGDRVKLISRTNPDGKLDLGPAGVEAVQGKVKLIEGIRPGVIAASWHYGHWAYGARDVVIDGRVVKGDARRRGGLCPNPVMLLDMRMKTTCLTDPIGGSASFYDTRVKVEKV
ncbi:Tetrathionate reductase subunit A [Moorella humiferrea]|uniref:molybdopterin-dependent oxidoreductase n=1 Tax=Neomoorella humiferrea TaxID=676965 RepID=UPI0030CBDDC3